jgi:hypothetical protein
MFDVMSWTTPSATKSSANSLRDKVGRANLDPTDAHVSVLVVRMAFDIEARVGCSCLAGASSV